jgi:glycosyltransferase involved in cell wall biosynthesis
MNTKIKITYIISLIDKAFAFEWLAEYLDKGTFSPSFILLNPGSSQLESYLRRKSIPVKTIRFMGKKSYPSALFRIWWNLILKRPDIIHCHLFDACILGLLAGKLAGIKRLIFTRHHSKIHHSTNPSGLKWDKLCNLLATDIIAISKNIEEILIQMDKANAGKIKLINHGFDFSYFVRVDKERLFKLRTKYNLREDHYPVIGVISRYTEWKGIQYIIPAFNALTNHYPRAHLLLANTYGDYEKEIRMLLRELPAGSFTEIPFEEDLSALYGLFTLFIHVPVDPISEAFGQTYIEALISGIPSVFTLSGIAREVIQNHHNGIVVDYKNSDEIFTAMMKILTDDSFREKLREGGRKSVRGFSIESHLRSLENLYTHPSNE